jgi:hypothetical protein
MVGAPGRGEPEDETKQSQVETGQGIGSGGGHGRQLRSARCRKHSKKGTLFVGATIFSLMAFGLRHKPSVRHRKIYPPFLAALALPA